MIKLDKKLAATLAVVLIPLGLYAGYAYRDYREKAILADIDEAVSLGNRAANAVGNYQLKTGRLPAALADLPEKIEDSPVATLMLGPAGEVVVTLQQTRPASIAGKRMVFRPVIIGGMVLSVNCQPEDSGDFRQLTQDRCD